MSDHSRGMCCCERWFGHCRRNGFQAISVGSEPTLASTRMAEWIRKRTPNPPDQQASWFESRGKKKSVKATKRLENLPYGVKDVLETLRTKISSQPSLF